MKRIRILGYFLLTGDLLGIILSFCLARSVLMVSVTSVLAVLQIVWVPYQRYFHFSSFW